MPADGERLPNGATYRTGIEVVRLSEYGSAEIAAGADDGLTGVFLQVLHRKDRVHPVEVQRLVFTLEDAAVIRDYLNTLELPEPPHETF